MKKIFNFVIAIIALVFAFSLTGCGDNAKTSEKVEKIQNDYGVVIEGDDFTSGTTISFQAVTDNNTLTTVTSTLANQEYNKEAAIKVFDISLYLDGNKIQPSKAVNVSIPTKDLNIDETKEYKLFHIKGDNTVESLHYTLTNDALKFSVSSFSYFVVTEKEVQVSTFTITWKNYDGTILETDTNVEKGAIPAYNGQTPTRQDDDNNTYTFNGWTPTLVQVGADATYTATFVSSPKEHVHDYGAYYYALPATFFEDGNIKYYHCVGCDKYFDENYNEVDSVVIPKLSSDVVLLVNGTLVGDFVITTHDNDYIEWDLSNVSLEKDDVISVAAKVDNTKTYTYFPNTQTNITDEFKVHNDVDSATIHIDCTPNGLYLSISGFEYDGFTLKVTYASNNNTIEYPMNLVEYNFGTATTSYVYGYLEYSEGDKFVIVDHDNDVTYDYTNVASGDLWKEFIFTTNANNEIVINKTIKLGVEFIVGDNEILIDPIYAPNSSTSYSLEVKGEDERAPMEMSIIQVGTDDYNEMTYVMTHQTTINNEEVRSAIANGYVLYSFTATLPANVEVRIFDGTNYVSVDHLLDVFGVDDISEYGEFTNDGYLKIKQAGAYTFIYHPCIDGYTVSVGSSVPTGISYMTGGQTYPAEVDSNGLVTISDFEASQYTSITFLNGTDVMSDVTLDSSVSATTAIISSGTILLVKAGTYDIVLNTNTKVVTITDKTPASVVGGMIMNMGSYATKTFAVNPENSEEAYATGYVVSDTTKMHAIFDSKDEGITDISVASDSSEYVSLLMAGSYIVSFSQEGTYSVYINITTHVIRVVKTA